MKFSKWQWRAAFVLDVLFKFMLAYGGAILASLGLVVLVGIEYVVEFSIVAVAMASLNVVYLLLGQRAVAAIDWPMIAYRPILRAILVLICGNAMFAGSLIALFSFQGGFAESAIFSTFRAATNLVPILIVAFFGWMLCLARRVSCRCAGQEKTT
jgi:hypothetical protein